MGIVASILPWVTAGLGFLVVILTVALLVLLVVMIRSGRSDWEDSDVTAARQAPVVKSIPNSKAHWRSAPEPEWSNPAAARALIEHFASVGFRKVGAFMHSGRKSVIVLFAEPEHHAAGWLQESEAGEIDLTLCSWTAEGAVPIRVSTVKSESSFVLLPGERRQIAGTRSPAELCRQLVELRVGLALRQVTVENVIGLLNREERERARRLSQDEETAEIWGRHLLKTRVRDEETGEKISGKVLRSVFLSQLGDTITDCCLESFAEQSEISAADWARLHDRFLVVHDRLATKELRNLDVCEELSREEFDRLRPHLKKRIPAREAFEALNRELPPHLRYTRVGRISDPIEATVYLAS